MCQNFVTGSLTISELEASALPARCLDGLVNFCYPEQGNTYGQRSFARYTKINSRLRLYHVEPGAVLGLCSLSLGPKREAT